MAAETDDDPNRTPAGPVTPRRDKFEPTSGVSEDDSKRDAMEESSEGGKDEEDGEEVEEEPKLKYHRLTDNLTPVYRSGDSTSSFVVSGDKLVSLILFSLPVQIR
jgi:vacuolar protein sorting-associated protein 41